MDDLNDNTILAKLYIHICQDGSIYFLDFDINPIVGDWGDVDRLKEELKALTEEEALLEYSLDDLEDEPTEEFATALELLNEYEPKVMSEAPHPALHGYYKSYRTFIYKAYDFAEMDVAGLEALLRMNEQFISEADNASSDYEELVASKDKLKEDLARAQHDYQRLREIVLELCIEAEGAEQ